MTKAKAKPKKKAEPAVDKNALSVQLRAIIEARGMTAYALGQASGVDPTVIARFASGERDIRMETADKLAKALGAKLVDGAVKVKGRGRPAKKGADV